MCRTMEDMRDQSLREGIKEGMRAGKKEVAKKMLEDGTIAKEKIAKFVGLSVDEVEKLETE